MKSNPADNGHSFDLVDFNFRVFELTWFRVLHSIHYVFNDFLLLAVNMVLDIMLVKLIRKDLRMKLDFSISSHSIKPDYVHVKKALEEAKKAEENTNKMIIFLFLTYLTSAVCRSCSSACSCSFATSR